MRAQRAYDAWPVLPSVSPSLDGPLFGESTAAPVVASLLLPGLGQALDGRRWMASAFAALEVAGWWVALDGRRDGRRLRGEYRDFAWEVARGSPIPRVEGPFEYYERLTQWPRSGAFDADPSAPGIQPERAPDAFNGRQWRLAADIFLRGDLDASPIAPGYDSALEYYSDRAYPAELAWDWAGDSRSQQRFADVITASDDAFRRSSVAFGAVVANHLLSAIEVYVHRRLQRDAVDLSVTPGVGPIRGAGMLRIRLFH